MSSDRGVVVFAHGDRWLYVLWPGMGHGVLEAKTETAAQTECMRSFPGWPVTRMRQLDVGAGIVDPWPSAGEVLAARRRRSK